MGFKPVKIAVAAVLLCVPIALAILAAPRFSEGVGIEPFERVKTAAIGGEPVPQETYQVAATAFEKILPDDGAQQGWRATFLALSAGVDRESISRTRSAAIDALLHAPVDTNAWTVLCEAEAAISDERGAHCLDTAFLITRYDWYTTNKRMALLAFEWPYLDQPLRDRAVGMVLPIWRSTDWPDGSSLRWVLLDLSRTPNGRQLLLAGLLSNPDNVRDFNRWVIQEEIDGH